MQRVQLLPTASQQNAAASASDSCRAICLWSLGRGAQEQVFAGVDGSERYITRYTTYTLSSLSRLVWAALESAIRWPRVHMSTTHRSLWQEPWLRRLKMECSSVVGHFQLPPELRVHRRPSAEGEGVGGSAIFWEHQFSQTWPARERHVVVAHCHSGRWPWFVFT